MVANKAKANSDQPLTGPGWPFVYLACVAQMVQRALLLTGRPLVRIQAQVPDLIRPVRSANYSRGIASGKPKAEFTRLTVILVPSPEESKGQIDLPFL